MGYDMIELPMFAYGNNLDYTVKTLASKGKITTKYFRRKFNKEKLTNNIRFFINIGTPKVARLNENYTVQFNIEKNSLRKTNNRESIYMMDTFLEADIDNYTFTLNRPKEERFFIIESIYLLPQLLKFAFEIYQVEYKVTFQRRVSGEYIDNLKITGSQIE